MQIDRLFQIVYLLMERKCVTAKDLAQRFEVSVRTVYRDIDTLSAAGVPVYANRGKGGGIRLMDDFVLNRSLLSEKEQNDILASLQGLRAIQVPQTESVLTKLAALFGKNQTSWIDVDFSSWGGGLQEREKFEQLQNAVVQAHVVSFDYFAITGEKSERTVEPLKILFKGMSWYLYGFCRARQDFRVFKISRIKNLTVLDEIFTRAVPEHVFPTTDSGPKMETILLKMKVDSSMAFRVYDEFDADAIVINPDASYTVTIRFPKNEWLYGYLLSFGAGAEVLEPPELRQEIAAQIKQISQKYH